MVCFKSSCIEVSLQCRKTIPAQHIAAALLFSLIPLPPSFPSFFFVGFGSAEGAEIPLERGTSHVAAKKQPLQLEGASGVQIPSEALSIPLALCQTFPSVHLPFPVFIFPVPDICPCYTQCRLHAPDVAALVLWNI